MINQRSNQLNKELPTARPDGHQAAFQFMEIAVCWNPPCRKNCHDSELLAAAASAGAYRSQVLGNSDIAAPFGRKG